MIHTVEFYTNITLIEKEWIERRHGESIKRVIRKLNQQFEKFNIRIGRQLWNKSYNIYLQADIVQMLGRTEDGVVREEDYHSIQNYISEIEQQLFDSDDKHFILNRVDYRLDIKVKDKEERKILFKLWRKLACSYGHLKKRNRKSIGKVQENGKEIFASEKAYKTTLYLASKSLVVCIYDKEEERKSKGINPLTYEEDVIRFEVRLMPKHLSYRAREKNVERTLETYLQDKCFEEYMQKYVLNIFGVEDFHKIHRVRERLDEAVKSKLEQEKIIQFLKVISRSGVEGAVGYRKKKGNKKAGYSRYLMNKYKDILSQQGIHIILLSVKTKGVADILVNPLSQVNLKNK